MKKLTKSALLAAGVALITQAAQAAFTVNDLYLGYTQPAATSDLIIDLGQASSLIGGSSVVDLSGTFGNALSTFNTTFNSTANGVSMGVIGGNNTFGSFGVFATQVRAGGAGNAAVAGSSITATHSSSQMSGGAAAVSGLTGTGSLPTAGNFFSDPNKTFSSTEVAATSGSFVNKTGVNPAGTIDNTGIIYEDLYAATTGSAYTYKGYFTFNFGTDSLTFTPSTVAVPEPGSYGLLAGFGVLVLALRRQFSRKSA